MSRSGTAVQRKVLWTKEPLQVLEVDQFTAYFCQADLPDFWRLNCVGSGFFATAALRLCIIGKEMYGKGKVL